MPCSKPLNGYRGDGGKLVFNKDDSKTGIPLQVPCGQCWSCRLQRSRDWAVRLVKESMYWPDDKRLFLTLTYAPEHLPENGTLKKEDFQNFMKALRYEFSYRDTNPETGRLKRFYPDLKYFHCGEYGQVCLNCGKSKPVCKCGHYHPTIGRPHYHAILFGVSFDDMEEFKKTKAREMIYTSKKLTSLWGKGHCSIGAVTFESCAYVARYIMKKITGDAAEGHYMKPLEVDNETGEILKAARLSEEYITMSRNPAIAKEYYDEFNADIFPHDRVVIRRGQKPIISKPPRYFLKQLEKTNKEMYEQVKKNRKKQALKHAEDSTPERAYVIEQVKKAQTKNLERHFEQYHD